MHKWMFAIFSRHTVRRITPFSRQFTRSVTHSLSVKSILRHIFEMNRSFRAESDKMQGRLENLPFELTLWILAEIPDIQSLARAVLTGPRLYSVFMFAQTQITKTVLLRQIHPDLLRRLSCRRISAKRGTLDRRPGTGLYCAIRSPG